MIYYRATRPKTVCVIWGYKCVHAALLNYESAFSEHLAFLSYYAISLQLWTELVASFQSGSVCAHSDWISVGLSQFFSTDEAAKFGAYGCTLCNVICLMVQYERVDCGYHLWILKISLDCVAKVTVRSHLCVCIVSYYIVPADYAILQSNAHTYSICVMWHTYSIHGIVMFRWLDIIRRSVSSDV